MSQNSASAVVEIGSLWTRNHGQSQFVGSSSGVFFVQTVRNAFSNAATDLSRGQQHRGPSPDPAGLSSWSPELIYGSETHTTPREGVSGVSSSGQTTLLHDSLPDYPTARRLCKLYFRTWQSLIPFIHAPSLLTDLEELNLDNSNSNTKLGKDLAKDTILLCVLQIGALEDTETQNRCGHGGSFGDSLLPHLAVIAMNDSLTSIQALLSCQLYFVATMSFHAASITGGLISRSIMKAGLHRCPWRYPGLTSLERDMRKRVIWSAYVLDRFLSQALGHPLGLQDADIDVCLPGTKELHEPMQRGNSAATSASVDDTAMPLSSTHREGRTNLVGRAQTSTVQCDVHPDTALPEKRSQHVSSAPDLLSLHAEWVHGSQFLGRTVDTFHGSIHVRSASPERALRLKADIDAWANSSVYEVTSTQLATNLDLDDIQQSAEYFANVFLSTYYHHMVLLVNRPALSKERSSAEFQAAVQKCIGAAKSILQILSGHMVRQLRIFWPGHLLAVWMSGLVIAFAGRINAYNKTKAAKDISLAIKLLDSMSQRWSRAIPCRSVLSLLLDNIVEQPQDPGANAASTRTSTQPNIAGEIRGIPENTPSNAKSPSANSENSQHRRKRTRLSTRRDANSEGALLGLEDTPNSLLAANMTRPDIADNAIGGVGENGRQSGERQPILDNPMTPSHADASIAWQNQQATSMAPAALQERSDFDPFHQMDTFADTGNLDDIYLDSMGWDSLQQLVTDLDWSL
ncbi:hypothetical protein PV10_01477 [Exophiala mesophila]|uniref:Xylanolytic transcriptional activator regulatory domain-containing protein n=1 Tax=Exophiala mesophila TaxID=212818 RepID=A0A0D1ZUV7_EXOME|nr:uncharacterized protein PV10_01477 [Exophiala mesophila]KIV97769.1 hypothetical protein PV10_01477 [Exophiala mesophila]